MLSDKEREALGGGGKGTARGELYGDVNDNNVPLLVIM